jgi:quercetin dioxygenase-like cupin family protein
MEYAPGGRSASHHNAGSVFADVLDGAIRSKLDDGSEVVYRAVESFFEPPGTRHALSENASGTERAKLLAVFVAETGAKLTTFDE